MQMKLTQATSNVHAQRKIFALGTQRNLYSTGNGVHVGYPTRMKSTQKNEMYMTNARDTNMLVFLALANAKVLSFALDNAKLPDASSFASQWNIGLSVNIMFI